jgi:hypothetical protein
MRTLIGVLGLASMATVAANLSAKAQTNRSLTQINPPAIVSKQLPSPSIRETNVSVMRLDEDSRNALQPPKESSSTKLLWLITGAAIGSLSGLVGTYYSHRLQTKEKKRDTD